MKMLGGTLGALLLAAVLVSCSTVERTDTGCGTGDEEVQLPKTVAAYKADLRTSIDFCKRWGLVDDQLRCEEELKRLEQEGTMPKEFDPVMADILKRCLADRKDEAPGT
jgi:hypothetical protein